MTLTVKHPFQSAKGDGLDTTLVQPSNWNASHDLEMATGAVLGRATAGSGVVEEITYSSLATLMLAAIEAALALGSLASLNSVLTAYITDANVTNAKLANVATATFKGRATAGTGAPEDLTAAQAAVLLPPLVGDTGAGGTKGLVPAPAAGDAGKFLGGNGAWRNPIAPDIIVEEHQSAGVNGQDTTGGSDLTRVLNIEVRDALNIASVSSNQLIITGAGTYYFEWAAPIAGGGNAHQSILRDITGNADLARGSTEFGANGTPEVSSRSVGQAVFTFAGGTNVFEVRSHVQTGRSGGGGFAAGFGTEIYTSVKVWKVG